CPTSGRFWQQIAKFSHTHKDFHLKKNRTPISRHFALSPSNFKPTNHLYTIPFHLPQDPFKSKNQARHSLKAPKCVTNDLRSPTPPPAFETRLI
ncbi:hypothetical protein AVEN_56146-1, partial [Araneus ventricosus]